MLGYIPIGQVLEEYGSVSKYIEDKIKYPKYWAEHSNFLRKSSLNEKSRFKKIFALITNFGRPAIIRPSTSLDEILKQEWFKDKYATYMIKLRIAHPGNFFRLMYEIHLDGTNYKRTFLPKLSIAYLMHHIPTDPEVNVPIAELPESSFTSYDKNEMNEFLQNVWVQSHRNKIDRKGRRINYVRRLPITEYITSDHIPEFQTNSYGNKLYRENPLDIFEVKRRSLAKKFKNTAFYIPEEVNRRFEQQVQSKIPGNFTPQSNSFYIPEEVNRNFKLQIQSEFPGYYTSQKDAEEEEEEEEEEEVELLRPIPFYPNQQLRPIHPAPPPLYIPEFKRRKKN